MASIAPAYKRKVFPFSCSSAWLEALLQSGPSVLAINWLAQGMRGMSAKELLFRLSSEAVCASMLALLMMHAGSTVPAAVAIATVTAHSLAFTFNGQLWVAARYSRGFVGSERRLRQFLADTATGLRACTWLDEAIVIGSVASGALGHRSDIDLRFVFPPGVAGWWRTNLLLLRLRSRAFLRRVPLDLYAYRDLAAFDRFDRNETLVFVLDRQGRAARHFAGRTWSELA